MKDFLSHNYWPVFNVKDKQNHNAFIDWVNQTVQEFSMPDKLISTEMSISLEALAI